MIANLPTLKGIFTTELAGEMGRYSTGARGDDCLGISVRIQLYFCGLIVWPWKVRDVRSSTGYECVQEMVKQGTAEDYDRENHSLA